MTSIFSIEETADTYTIIKVSGKVPQELKTFAHSDHLYKIPVAKTFSFLKLFALTGQITFKKNNLICDFFSRFQCKIQVRNEIAEGFTLVIFFFNDHKKISLESCDLIGNSSEPWFIKAPFLYFLDIECPFKLLSKLKINPILSKDQLLELIKEDYHGLYIEAEIPLITKIEPHPILQLQDSYGMFANLNLDYGNNKIISFHSSEQFPSRNLTYEKSLEKDLLETGFLNKLQGNTHYFCPADKVAKTLSFLLEIGWTILDIHKRKIVHYKSSSLTITQEKNHLRIAGSIKFDNYEADIENLVGTFNKKDRFILINPTTVGLFPENWQTGDLVNLLEEIEVDKEGVKLSKNAIGYLTEQSDKTLHFQLDDSLKNLLDYEKKEQVILSEEFLGQLRPYQLIGIEWLSFLYTNRFAGILADDMGLGKTVQVIACLANLKTNLPIIVIVPTSLVFNWEMEFKKFIPKRTLYVHQGAQRLTDFSKLSSNVIIITSYAIARIDKDLLKSTHFEAVILDEAQAIKNSDTQIAQVIYQLRANFRLSITGTPIENNLNELWSQFRFLLPDLLEDKKSFAMDIEASFSDLRYLRKIKKKIKPFIMRRTKEEVAKDLPEKIEQVIYLEMTPLQKSIYDSFLQKIKKEVVSKVKNDPKKHRMEILESILRLRQICCHPFLVNPLVDEEIDYTNSSPKLEQLLEDLKTLQLEGKKVIVYSQFTKMLKLIVKEVQKLAIPYAYLDGETKNREEAVNLFQNDPNISLFLISLKAGGVGLNLTAADYVYLFDPWWNNAVEEQAINRAHRIGRKEIVIAKKFIMIESIEEKLVKIKEAKKSLSQTIIDDEEFINQNWTIDDFLALLS